MGEKTSIAWTDRSWNPWQGCHKVTLGCQQCYMFRDKIRYGQNPDVVVRSKPPTFNAPLSRKWNQENAAGQRVFVCSWSDFFIEEADPWRAEAYAIMASTPWLTYQILTKRPERIDGRWAFLPNVWLGVTAEDQAMADLRIPQLLAVPAAVRFVSCEPLLGEVDLDCWSESGCPRGWLDDSPGLNMVITGGESGPRARPMQTVWARAIRDQCRAAGVPFFFKQLGEWRDECTCDGEPHEQMAGMYRCGCEVCGDLLDGQQYHEFPAQ